MDSSLDPVEIADARILAASGVAHRVRLAHAMTVGEIARRLDVAPSSVDKWERGVMRPSGLNAVEYGRLIRRLMAL